ncbi:unnamed protein product [Lymnaea stagnalis]|uniref:CCHC-type domain-containing protein n=1 Tax=Lymnaea stagnalis TaxID=6523 RepID=A0AAV2I4Q1_LYMST
MADVFADLDLFSEFDKDREAQASFIHYDEDSVKSRIVFEDYESEKESESEDDYAGDFETKEPSAGKELVKTEIQNDAALPGVAVESESEKLMSDVSVSAKDETSEEVKTAEVVTEITDDSVGQPIETITEDEMIIEDDANNEIQNETSQYDPYAYNFNGSAEIKPEEEMKLSPEDEAKAAWLNEQLYSEAAEEAKKTNISTQHLIFERNKFRRYAKILDSTRYAPDDDSPAVQLLFNNNSFARKYRQQIEQFIKGLLWEEFHSMQQESVSEIIIKPGHPSCIDINSSLPLESRTEKMRQRHGIIGNSQFHKQFLIDFLGWPFTVAEPTRCNVNWEIPLYGQVFNEVYADPTNKLKKMGTKRQKQACWNCGEENHAVNDCKQQRIPSRIASNRREFLTQQQQNASSFEPKFTGPSRYHLDPELASKFTKFKPGVVSESLREALGLSEIQLPQHIYKMRLFGYPPGWLAEARQVESGVTIFDKNGRVTLITGECLEDGELDDESSESKMEYDVNKIIEYPGFTIPVPSGYVDEHAVYKMPPIQQHQLKKTLMSQSSEKVSAKKRKREKERDEDEECVKKLKTDEDLEEGEAKEEGEEGNITREEENTDMKESTTLDETQPPTNNEAEAPPSLMKSSSTISLSKDFGTPILVREKIRLPDASKFGKNIEEHIPYENLPNSTGIFDKMRDLLEEIRKKAKK